MKLSVVRRIDDLGSDQKPKVTDLLRELTDDEMLIPHFGIKCGSLFVPRYPDEGDSFAARAFAIATELEPSFSGVRVWEHVLVTPGEFVKEWEEFCQLNGWTD